MALKNIIIITILLLIIHNINISYSLPMIPYKENNIYSTFPFLSSNPLNLTKYGCDPDINTEFNECYIYIKYYVPKPSVENITDINGTFYTSLSHWFIQDYYDSMINAYKQYIVFPAPGGATSCEDFFTDDFVFNLTSTFIANNPAQNNITLDWKIRVYVWSCNNPTADGCKTDRGEWQPCIDETNTSYITVPKNLASIGDVRSNDGLGLSYDPAGNKVYVYPHKTFNVYVIGSNVNDETHGGTSLNSWINLTSSPSPAVSLLSNNSIFIGNVSSGKNKTATFTFRSNDANSSSWHTLYFNYSDFSEYYTSKTSLNIYITNLSIPKFYITTPQPLSYGERATFLIKTYGNATPIEYVKVVIYNETNNYTFTSNTSDSCENNITCTYHITTEPLISGNYKVRA